jgi:L-fuculose-phosphate aldolase
VSQELAVSEEGAAELVAQACRILGKLELSHAALGHVSFRCGEDRMLIKGKGPDEVGLRYTHPSDVIEVDFSAAKTAGPGGLQPPSESFLHSWLYKTNPAVRSVVHVHPEAAVLLSICGKEILPIYGAFGPGARIAARGVRTYPRSVRICDDALGQDFARFIGRDELCLMRGHGVTVTGSSVPDAAVRSIALNELVSMTYKAYLLGQPRPISAEDLEQFTGAEDEQRARGSAGGHAGMLATWRYYCMLTGEDPGSTASVNA